MWLLTRKVWVSGLTLVSRGLIETARARTRTSLGFSSGTSTSDRSSSTWGPPKRGSTTALQLLTKNLTNLKLKKWELQRNPAFLKICILILGFDGEGYGRSIFEPLLPIILGRDISGEVTAIGTSVQSLSVGQQVFGALHPTAVRGTYTDCAVLSEDELAPKPASVTHVVGTVVSYDFSL